MAENSRFDVVYDQWIMDGSKYVVETLILRDKTTGVNYVLPKTGDGVGGMAALLDKNGNPIITGSSPLTVGRESH